ncbi:MAG TPA: hypothetical protein VJX67_02395, partial [Blastocatellia bacterium]|nr:hypothetical protein [Blastocatellia bacterium]
MWIRKGTRDQLKGVDSPMPTQIVSNEEFIPRRQNAQQKQVEHLIGEMADEKSKKLGISRRSFMAGSLGLATCFLASNKVYGKIFDVDEVETMELDAYNEKWPKGEYFVIDVQTHFTNGYALPFRDDPFIKGMGFNLKNDPEAYGFANYVKEIYYDSETMMGVISGVPSKETYRGPDGKVLYGKDRDRGILPSWLMAQSKKQLNELAGCERSLSQGNLAPNHYWDKVKNQPDK